MGDSITEGSIAAVLKQPGDIVQEDDVIAQIETDKVTIDVKFTAKSGKVTSILVAEGDTVTVGQPVAQVEPGSAAGSVPPASGDRPERRVKMTRLRLRVAERLKGAQNTYAMLTTFNEVDMSGLMEMRSTFKDIFLEKHGVKLGFMSAFVKAAAGALVEVPAVNAVIDGNEIIYRSVDKLSFADVEKTINSLGRKAREGTISIDEMAGGTFTISNGGVYGSMLSTPIINPPQSAILGMHNITPRAMVVGKGIEARPMMYIALTYDHRLIDGREAVTFLKRVKEVVEDPRRLLLGV
eukprot:gene7670-7872_t